jgi:hypothetical protein
VENSVAVPQNTEKSIVTQPGNSTPEYVLKNSKSRDSKRYLCPRVHDSSAHKLEHKRSQALWLTAVIPATQKTEIRRMAVQSQPGQIVHKTLSQKNPSQKRAGVAQGVDPEFKPQYHRKKKKA